MLSLLCLIPLVGAFVTAVVSRRAWRPSSTTAGAGPSSTSAATVVEEGALAPVSKPPILVALAFATLTLALGIAAVAAAGPENHSWIGALGVRWALGLDGLGRLMVLLTVALVPIVMAAAWLADERHGPRWFAWALALESFALVVFLAQDVFVFYVFFEATLIPAYFMIGSSGGPRRSTAALKFLMYQLGGGLVLLGGVIGLYVVSAQHGTPSYLISDLRNLPFTDVEARWIFVAFFVAFAVKAPLFPLHTWLADTTEQATPATSVLLVCVLDKIGTFGMIRFCLGILPDASHWATPVVVTVALISIVYGAVLAIGQDDLLRLIGLTSLSHFGLITLGIFAWTQQGGAGAILYMVNHGVATAAMFLAAGFLIRRHGTASISVMRGLERSVPVLAGVFLVAGLATAGLPGLSQFVSEIMVLIGAFDYHWWVGAIAVTAVVLAAIYILWAYQRIFTGPAVGLDTPTLVPRDGYSTDDVRWSSGEREGYSTDDRPTVVEEVAQRPSRNHGGAGTSAVGAGGFETGAGAPSSTTVGIRDLTRAEVGILVPVLAALVLFGFYPAPLLHAANPPAAEVLQHAGVPVDPPEVTTAGEAH